MLHLGPAPAETVRHPGHLRALEQGGLRPGGAQRAVGLDVDAVAVTQPGEPWLGVVGVQLRLHHVRRRAALRQQLRQVARSVVRHADGTECPQLVVPNQTCKRCLTMFGSPQIVLTNFHVFTLIEHRSHVCLSRTLQL